VLKETEDLLSEEALTLEKGENLQDIVEGCRCVLSDIEELLEKFNRLGSNSRRTFDRLRWSHEEASALRDRITASAGLLTAFNSAVQVCVFQIGTQSRVACADSTASSSLARLQRTLDSFISEVRGGLREKSVVSSLTDDTIPIEQKEGWRQIRKELEDMGNLLLYSYLICWFSDITRDSHCHSSGEQTVYYQGPATSLPMRDI